MPAEVKTSRLLINVLWVFLGGCAGLFGESNRNAPLTPGAAGYVDPGPWVGPLAQKHAGKVLFSSKPIALTDSDDSSLYTTYELGAPLYIRFFSKESPGNLMPQCQSPRAVYRADLNGEFAGQPAARMTSFGHFNIGEELRPLRGAHVLTDDAKIAMTTPAAQRAQNNHANETIEDFTSKVIARLREGTNSLRILVNLDCGAADDSNPIYAEGTLNILVKPGARAEYLALYGAQLGPSPHRENAQLVPEMIAAMKTLQDWSTEEFLGAQVLSPNWIPVRNQLTGVLIQKQIEALVVVRQKAEKDTESCRAFTIVFGRDVAGGPLFYVANAGHKSFVCSSAPK